MYKRFILFFLQLLALGATLYLAYVLAGNLFLQLELSDIWQNVGTLFLATLLFLLHYAILAFHWQYVAQLNATTRTSRQWLAFFASQPYKYLPSSIFTFSFRAKFAKNLGLGLKDSSKAQLIENFNLIGAALSLALVLVLVQLSLALGLAIATLAIMVLILIYRFDRPLTVGIKKIRFSLRPSKWVPAFAISVVAWLVAGMAFTLVSSIYSDNLNIIAAIAANSAAFAGGILAVFAPGGIGVREVIFAYFSVAGGAIILWRLLTLGVDIILGIIAAVWIHHLKAKY